MVPNDVQAPAQDPEPPPAAGAAKVTAEATESATPVRADAGAAIETPPAAPSRIHTLRTVTVRILLSICGLGMLVGFFLPWVDFGSMMQASGFQLIMSSGEMAERLSGPHRIIPLAVPILGVLMVVGAVVGHRLAQWVAVLSSMALLAYGIATLLTVFLESTGLGVWLVVSAAFIALAVGLLSIGADRRV